MNLTVRIPDDLARRLAADGSDLSRRALEALALAEYQAGRLTTPELRRLLGYGTRAELDGFLKAHGVVEGLAVGAFDQDTQDLDRRSAADDLVAQFQAFAAGHTLGGLDIKTLISEGRRSSA